MNDFLAKLPPLLATLSKAFLNAIIEQLREVARILQRFLRFLGRLFLRVVKQLWAIYYRIETQIIGVGVDFGLAVFALRYFFLLLGIGVFLVYFKQWITAGVYLLLLGIAAFRFFRIDRETIAQENEHHKQSHEKFIRLLRLPFRIVASVVIFYVSWQFVGWRHLNVSWLHKLVAENSEKIIYNNAPVTSENTESEQTKTPPDITHLEAKNVDESPFFMTRTVDENDLRDKSKWELDVMRNEVFARHGRRFKRSDLQTYFNGQAWYKPRYASDEFPLSLLTPIQKRNVDFILKYQNRKYPAKEAKDNVSLQ